MEKTVWFIRATRGDVSMTERFLSLDDAVAYGVRLSGWGYEVNLYEARKVAFEVAPA